MDTGLAWGVKSSFLRYVASDSTSETVLADGAGELVGGGFYFTPTEATETRFGFRGIVSFRAHGGLLSVVIADPVVDIAERMLLVRIDGDGSLRPLVDLELPAPTGSDGFTLWVGVETALRPESVEAFGGVYAAGTRFDPLVMRVASA